MQCSNSTQSVHLVSLILCLCLEVDAAAFATKWVITLVTKHIVRKSSALGFMYKCMCRQKSTCKWTVEPRRLWQAWPWWFRVALCVWLPLSIMTLYITFSKCLVHMLTRMSWTCVAHEHSYMGSTYTVRYTPIHYCSLLCAVYGICPLTDNHDS